MVGFELETSGLSCALTSPGQLSYKALLVNMRVGIHGVTMENNYCSVSQFFLAMALEYTTGLFWSCGTNFIMCTMFALYVAIKIRLH